MSRLKIVNNVLALKHHEQALTYICLLYGLPHLEDYIDQGLKIIYE